MVHMVMVQATNPWALYSLGGYHFLPGGDDVCHSNHLASMCIRLIIINETILVLPPAPCFILHHPPHADDKWLNPKVALNSFMKKRKLQDPP